MKKLEQMYLAKFDNETNELIDTVLEDTYENLIMYAISNTTDTETSIIFKHTGTIIACIENCNNSLTIHNDDSIQSLNINDFCTDLLDDLNKMNE